MHLLLMMALFAGADVKSFAYQLQKVDPAQVGESRFDLTIVDPSRDGRDEGKWTPREMGQLHDGHARILLAYLSYGEAENYRGYWKPQWKAGQPEWLGEENPDWPGDFRVKLWDAGWQGIVFGKPASPLDDIIAMGFDGVYLDTVDTYEYWDKRGEKDSAKKAQEAVIALSRYAKSKKKGFLVYAQNAAELGASKEYRDALDGLGREDLYYQGETARDADEVKPDLADLDRFLRDGKPVLVVDYCREPEHVKDFYARCRKKGYVPYSTVRKLDAFTVNPDLDPR